MGYGWRRGAWEIDLAYQFTFGPDIDVATSDLAGGDHDGSRHEARAHVALISLLKRF